MNTSQTAPALHIEHLHKTFKDFWMRARVKAVQDLSFEIQPGEIFGLLGPNGSGKSTTIKILLGLLKPTSGTVQVLGKPPTDTQAKQRIGYLPEESYLYPYLTARETLRFYGKLFGYAGRELDDKVQALLEQVELTQHANRRVGEFSKGMARRVGLAQALLNDPQLIFLDEPTSGLDPLGTRQVKDIILKLAAAGCAVLLSSHLLSDVEEVCTRIAILYNGRIQAQGTIRELLVEETRSRLTFDELAPDQMKEILAELKTRFHQEPELDHPQKNLEQFFLDVIARAKTEGHTPR